MGRRTNNAQESRACEFVASRITSSEGESVYEIHVVLLLGALVASLSFVAFITGREELYGADTPEQCGTGESDWGW